MNVRKSISVLLAAACLSAGTNMFVANAAVVNPEISSYNNVEDSKTDEKIKSLQAQVKDLKAELAEAERRMIQYQYEMDDMQNSWQRERANLMEEIDVRDNQRKQVINDYEDQLASANRKIVDLQDQLSSVQKTNSSLSTENANLKKTNSSLTTENTNLKKTNSTLTSEKATLTSEKATLTADKASLTSQVAKLKSDATTYKDDIMRLDVNSDKLLDASDASMILSIYAYNSTNNSQITSISTYLKKK